MWAIAQDRKSQLEKKGRGDGRGSVGSGRLAGPSRVIHSQLLGRPPGGECETADGLLWAALFFLLFGTPAVRAEVRRSFITTTVRNESQVTVTVCECPLTSRPRAGSCDGHTTGTRAPSVGFELEIN